MLGIFAGKLTRASTIAAKTKGISFNQAMEDYRKVVGDGRIRTIAYKYFNDRLGRLIKEHFGVFFVRSTNGNMAKINHKGIEYVIVIKGEQNGKILFTITENY